MLSIKIKKKNKGWKSANNPPNDDRQVLVWRVLVSYDKETKIKNYGYSFAKYFDFLNRFSIEDSPRCKVLLWTDDFPDAPIGYVDVDNCKNCGSKPYIRRTNQGLFYIECNKCGMRGPFKESEEDAANFWNEIK